MKNANTNTVIKEFLAAYFVAYAGYETSEPGQRKENLSDIDESIKTTSRNYSHSTASKESIFV